MVSESAAEDDKSTAVPQQVNTARDGGTVYATAHGDVYATVYHDAAKLIIAAMERADTISGEAIQQALTGIRDFQGIVTRYGWTDNGDMTHSGIITRVAGGKPEIVKVITS